MKYLLEADGTDHTHVVTLDAQGNGTSSFDAGHSHDVRNKVVVKEFGHSHSMSVLEAFMNMSSSTRTACLAIGILFLDLVLLNGGRK